MTDFALDLIRKGEEPKSVQILLETYWPTLTDRIDLSWLRLIENSIPPMSHRENATDLGRSGYGTMTRGGDSQSVVDRDSTPSEWDIRKLRDECQSYELQRAEKTEKRLADAVINRVKAEWCCRYQVTTDFIEEKCIRQYCEDRRCFNCLNFNSRQIQARE